MLIYLADLVHDQYRQSSVTPTNIGFIAEYCKARFGESVEIELFKNPKALMDSSSLRKPDILGLSNYMWNERLNAFVAEKLKKQHEDLMVVVGGPNIRTDKEGVGSFLREYNFIDFYILYGAEEPFASLVEACLGNGIKSTKFSDIEGCYSVRDDTVLGSAYITSSKTLDFIPSPFLSGRLDSFLEKGYSPLFETNRGCPYSCTFCVWGISALNKIKTFDLDRVKEELSYVARKYPVASTWILADANFGIMPRDLEIAELLRSIYNDTRAFNHVNIWWSKAVNHRTVEIAKILGKLCQAYVAFQSLDDEVLNLIKRSNISVEKLQAFKDEIKDHTNGTFTDILLGLPGETMESHIYSYNRALTLGFDRIGGGEVRLLPGSEMDTEEARHDFGLKTKYRVSESDAGVYEGQFVFEVEEVVRATNWITEEEMLQLRVIRALLYGALTIGALTPLQKFLISVVHPQTCTNPPGHACLVGLVVAL